MGGRLRGRLISAASLLGGILLVLAVTFVVRPALKNSAHLMGNLSAKGGMVIHAGEFQEYTALLGWYSANVTGKAIPPVQGDIRVSFEGDAPVNYVLNSRFPPGLPISNSGHPWYQYSDGLLTGVQPGDNISFNLRLQAPVPPGEYRLVFRNARTSQAYLTMPITFNESPATAAGAEDCH